MKIRLYQVDAFASKPFEGNPAAVCPLDEWLPDSLMQSIAAENNLSETVFFVPTDTGFHIRWFTPVTEVDLCGHATLASAFVIFNMPGYDQQLIQFDSRSGILKVTRQGELLELDFPARPPVKCSPPAILMQAFGVTPVECLRAEDYILVFDNEQQILDAHPDMRLLAGIDARGVAITARGRDQDFVCRFFAPGYGIDEDPVTGSAYTQLAPYWSGVLAKNTLYARQVSARGGDVRCIYTGERVMIAGRAVPYLSGWIEV